MPCSSSAVAAKWRSSWTWNRFSKPAALPSRTRGGFVSRSTITNLNVLRQHSAHDGRDTPARFGRHSGTLAQVGLLAIDALTRLLGGTHLYAPCVVNLVIRDAQLDDADAVAQLLGQLGYPTSAAAVADRVIRFTASGADRCVVAVSDDGVVGMATLHASLTIADDGLVAKLSAIVVDERYRQYGIGAALVSELEGSAHARGCSLMFLTTAGSRGEAHAFYRRVGFEETGRRFAMRLA